MLKGPPTVETFFNTYTRTNSVEVKKYVPTNATSC